MEKEMIMETVNKLFIAVDSRDWDSVENIFDKSVSLDYTSMAGGDPAELTPDQIISSWKETLPGFDSTHHQLGNYIITIEGTDANVFCYGTATHYLENSSENNLWVVVGSYELSLIFKNDFWRINKMKFNLKYIDGNNELPEMAQAKLN